MSLSVLRSSAEVSWTKMVFFSVVSLPSSHACTPTAQRSVHREQRSPLRDRLHRKVPRGKVHSVATYSYWVQFRVDRAKRGEEGEVTLSPGRGSRMADEEGAGADVAGAGAAVFGDSAK